MSHEERELLERIAARLDALEAKVTVQPRAYKIRDAGRLLGCSPAIVKAMIRSGEIRTVLIGERAHIPVSEIMRITTVATAKPRIGPGLPRRTAAKVPQSEMERMQALSRRKD